MGLPPDELTHHERSWHTRSVAARDTAHISSSVAHPNRARVARRPFRVFAQPDNVVLDDDHFSMSRCSRKSPLGEQMMLKRMAVVAAVVAAVCGTAPAISAASAVETGAVFTFDAEAGAHPVGDRSGDWSAPGHEIMVWEYDDVVKVDAATWSGNDFVRVELNGAGRAPLTTGYYPGVRNRDADIASPGMQVISNGLGCGDHYGEFTITRLERDTGGSLTALDATFTQRCGDPAGPALYGSIQFEA
jgi:hypothetical protein